MRGSTTIDWPGTAYRLDSKAAVRNEPIPAEGVFSKLPLAAAVSAVGTGGSSTAPARAQYRLPLFLVPTLGKAWAPTDQLPGRVNYFLADRRNQWQTNVPTCGETGCCGSQVPPNGTGGPQAMPVNTFDVLSLVTFGGPDGAPLLAQTACATSGQDADPRL